MKRKMAAGILLKIIMKVVIVLVLATVLFLMTVKVTGKGEIEPFRNADGSIMENSIAERIFVDINGRQNGMIIRGKDLNNPVLLFISGGPGVPQYWLNEYYDNKIEENYTVCWWEWYGEGMSYDSKLQKNEITMESLTKDAQSVAKYLRQRFGKEKIYLMAHSGGTPLGLTLAQNDEEDFYCYFAMGQYLNEDGSRYTAGYEYLKQYFTEQNDKKSLEKLDNLMEKNPDGIMVPSDPDSIAGKWEGLLLKAGCGTTREMRSDALDIFFPQIFSKCYTFSEKINFWRGKFLNTGTPYHLESISTDEKQTVIPVYFISGRYDYTCPVTLVEELYENLDAPDKGMYIFEDSAHSPLWEENEAVLEVMKQHTLTE